MIRMLSIYLLLFFVCGFTWYITQQLKDAYKSLKGDSSLGIAKPIFLLLAFILFTLAGIQSFLESPEDIPSHILLVITTILLSLALAINKASLKGVAFVAKRFFLKLKMAIGYQLIKFGKRK